MEQLEIISLFMIAFAGSFGHCVGMCGGIVLAYSSKFTYNASLGQIIFCHILYNLGRITTYVTLGAIVGTLGSLFSFHHTLRGALFVLAGIAIILAGLSLFGKIKFLTSLEYAIQNSKWYQISFQRVLQQTTYFNLYLLGLLNGLLPCGFVYTFLFSAAGFAETEKGALIMLVFGLGTLPALLFLGILTNTIFHQPLFRKTMTNLAAIIIVIFGIFMIQMGFKVFWGVEKHNNATHLQEMEH